MNDNWGINDGILPNCCPEGTQHLDIQIRAEFQDARRPKKLIHGHYQAVAKLAYDDFQPPDHGLTINNEGLSDYHLIEL